MLLFFSHYCCCCFLMFWEMMRKFWVVCYLCWCCYFWKNKCKQNNIIYSDCVCSCSSFINIEVIMICNQYILIALTLFKISINSLFCLLTYLLNTYRCKLSFAVKFNILKRIVIYFIFSLYKYIYFLLFDLTYFFRIKQIISIFLCSLFIYCSD